MDWNHGSGLDHLTQACGKDQSPGWRWLEHQLLGIVGRGSDCVAVMDHEVPVVATGPTETAVPGLW